MRPSGESGRPLAAARRETPGGGRVAGRVNAVLTVVGVLVVLASPGDLRPDPGQPAGGSPETARLASWRPIADGGALPVVAVAAGAAAAGEPSLRHRLDRWLLPVGVLLLATPILGFLAVAALFAPPVWAWFIYLFLMPFFIWLPGMTLGPVASWVVCGAWAIAFPVLRRWLYRTPSGRRWRRRQERRIARLGAGEAGTGGWQWSGRPARRGSAGSGRRGGGSGGLRRGGGRFGGGGASGRW